MKKLFLLVVMSTNLCSAQIKTHSGKVINPVVFERNIKQAMDSLKVPGMSIAIINNGRVVYAKGFGYTDLMEKKPVTVNTYFEAASMSKPVFSYYVLKLAKQGVIDLDKPLCSYLPAPDINDDRYQKITARMVLSHTTGLPNWRETEKIKLSFDPGTAFSYSGEGYVYLAKVIAHLKNRTLKNLDEDFQQEVAVPLKLKNFHLVLTRGIESNMATGYQNGGKVHDERDRYSFDPAGGMYANVSTYAAFLVRLMAQQSQFKPLFKPIISLKTEEPIRKYFGIDAWTAGLAVIPLAGSANYWHGGNNLGYTSSFMIDPVKKFGYVYFTNADQCNDMKTVFESILWK